MEQAPSQLLSIAFKELGIVSEELHVALEELEQQNEELQMTKLALATQYQHYQELFDFAPCGYVVITTKGRITEANCAAAKLLNVSQRLLVGKPLVVFITQEQQKNFHDQLIGLQQSQQVQKEWTLRLLPRNLPPVDVKLTVAKVSDAQGNLVGLRLCVSNLSYFDYELHSLPPAQANAAEDSFNSTSDCSKQTYLKGETIPIFPQTIWQVCQGVVKLSTMCENGEEVLVGLVSSGMVFGADLTALPTYQATALTKVQLVSFAPVDIATSLHLAGAVFNQISQRLRQTELLLAIVGQRRIKDRFYQLLQLMKQEIGQPVPLGTRLSVRLTHQDFADACSTTRVTITRLIGKLQERGKIKFDAKNHMIIINQDRQG
jgi:PAS domain S-box-containing protein